MCTNARWALAVLASAQMLAARTLPSQRQAAPCTSPVLPALLADTAGSAGSAGSAERANSSRRQCAGVSVLDSSTRGGVTARTLSEALAGRAAGVSVLRSSGVAGTGSRVRMRGGSGLLIPREPLLVIDGMRVDASQSSLGISVGGQTPSRLDDIPLDDVDRIETLRGPAASALYGTDAAGGVIVITTKRGAPGKARWSSYVDGGVTNDVADYPTNTATGPPTFGKDTCTRADAALGTCSPDPISRWNPLEQASPFRSGGRIGGGASVAGGSRAASYFAAGTASNDRGPFAPNDSRRYSGRTNVDLHPTASLRISARGSHVAARTSLPSGDVLSGLSTLYSGMMGNTADDPVLRGYLQNTPATLATVMTVQRIERSLGSVAAEWQPLRWLTTRGLVGRELLHRDDSSTLPTAAAFGDPSLSGTYRIQGSQGRDQRTTLAGSATASFQLSPRLTSQTILGVERLTQSFRTRDSVVTGTPEAGSRFERRSHDPRRTIGTYATQQLVWGSRVFSIGGRHDGGDRRQFIKPATYWSASSTWDVSDETFFHPTNGVSALAFHAAYGVAGDSRPLRVVLSSAPVLPPSAGEQPIFPRWAPERVSEVEVGADVGSFHERLRTDVTWYRQRAANSYERGCCIGPLGYDDGGGWHTNGFEVGVTAKAFQTPTSEWITRLTFTGMSNRYDRSPSNRSRVVDEPPFFGGARRRLTRGYPIAGAWGRPAIGRDANGDGVIVPSEITSPEDSVYLGSSIPTREAGLSTSLTVFRRLTFSAQLDYHGGSHVLNETTAFRCEIRTCETLYDPNASLAEQTRAVDPFGAGAGFLERGDFTRLRELAVTWSLAPGWSYRHGLAQFALTVAGRNLWISTPYGGLDPEANAFGQSSFGTTEFFTLPLARSLLIRVDVRH